jgi:hypothetical protein
MLAILRERRFLICAFAPTQRINLFTDLGQGVLGAGMIFWPSVCDPLVVEKMVIAWMEKVAISSS